MQTIVIEFEKTENPDFTGWNFYIEGEKAFDFVAYCEAYNINADDIDLQSVKACQDAAARLYRGEWLHVWHETRE